MEKIVNVKIDEIIPYEDNPRDFSNTIEPLIKSIKEFGWQQPILLDKNKVIIAGHARLEAAKKMGLKEVPCIIAEDLSDEKVKALRIADNKTAEIASWDYDKLKKECEGIFGDLKTDLSSFGFSNNEISRMTHKPLSEEDQKVMQEIDKMTEELIPKKIEKIVIEFYENGDQEIWDEFLSNLPGDTIGEKLEIYINYIKWWN